MLALGRWAAYVLPAGAVLLALVGAGLRFQHFLLNPPLWMDEANLALNYIQHPLPFLFGSLDDGQIAPIGFILPTWFVARLFDFSEQGLRLMPLIAGIALVGCVYPTGRKIAPVAGFVATAICAFSPLLIYFSVDFKPYSSDALIALLYLWAGIVLLDARSRRATVVIAAIGAAGFWFSYPAVMTAVPVAAALLIDGLAPARRDQFLPRLAVGLCWGVSFLLSYFYARYQLGPWSDFMQQYWTEGFLSSDPATLFTQITAAFAEPVGLSAVTLATGLSLGGLVWLLVRRPAAAVMLIGPVVIAAGAAIAQTYPFSERLILFLVPSLALLVGSGVAAIAWFVRLPVLAPVVAVIAMVLLVQTPAQAAVTRIRRNQTFYNFDVRSAAAHYRDNRQSGDVIYVHWLPRGTYRYYAYRLKIPDEGYISGSLAGMDWNPVLQEVRETLFGKRRAWLLTNNLGVNDDALPGLLNDRGDRLDYVNRGWVNLYLYDLD